MIRVKGPKDIPTGAHYQVLVYTTETVYESSGYDDVSDQRKIESFEQYVMTDTTELEAFVMALEMPASYATKRPYAVIKVEKKVSVKLETRIDLT